MKLNKLFLLLGLIMGAFVFTACGDDEPDPKAKQSELNKEVVGVYNGWTHLETNFINKDYTGDTFTLAQSEDGSLTATFADATWGTATITGINASKIESGEGYLLQEGEGSFVMNNPRENTTEEFGCRLSHATISADKKQMMSVIIANMTTTGGHGEMTFTFHTGILPTEE